MDSQEKVKTLKTVRESVKKDFKFLMNNPVVEAVLLYGSYAKGEQSTRSDIDVCIVAPSLKTPRQFSKLLSNIWSRINANKYYVRIFEELPLYIKIEIIKNYKVIIAKNLSELTYYFYHYRKIWQHQSIHRVR